MAAPEQELRRNCAFLGKEFSAGMLTQYHEDNAVHSEQRNAANLRQPILSSNTGKWRTQMSRRELRIFEALAGDTLERYSYPRALSRPRVSALEALSCCYLEHPPRRAFAMLRNREGPRLALQKLRLHLFLGLRV